VPPKPRLLARAPVTVFCTATLGVTLKPVTLTFESRFSMLIKGEITSVDHPTQPCAGQKAPPSKALPACPQST
jgi:hypothetical protein